MKNRIGAAIAWRAEAAAERRVEDLSTTVHGLAAQTRDTATGVAEWQARVNETFAEVAMRLDSIDHRAKENTQFIGSLRLVSDEVRASMQIIESRIRAQPFNSELSPFEVNVEGLSTIGFEADEDQTLADFADLFRPDSEDLKHHLRSYLKWLPTSGVAIDLGAGRGEMVDVLASAGLDAVGIDSDESMVDRCSALGLKAVKAEIGEHLASLADESADVISAIHVVEHVGTPELESWLREIARVLRRGGIFLAETPNPHAIDAFKAFWVDATHIRPYYPESLLHLAQVAGFSSALIWAEGDGVNIQERLGLAGSYAIIATK